MNDAPVSPPQLKIGYVVTHYPALSQSFVLNEVLGLEARGVDVSIFSLGGSADPKFNSELSRVKATVRYLPALDSPPGAVKAFKWARDLRFSDEAADALFSFVEDLSLDQMGNVLIQSLHLAHWVSQMGIEHLHAHFMHNPASCAYLVKLMTGTPFSVTAHAFDIYQEPIDAEWFRRVYSAAEALVTVCQSNRSYLADSLLEGDGSRLVCIYNGLPLDSIRPVPSPPRHRMVLGVGRLVEKKGWPVLLEACSIMNKNGVDFECVLVGDGLEMEPLLALRKELGLEDAVELLGGLKREDVLELMSSARVLAAPCVTAASGDRDALPTVILEALALGLPVVSTPVNGIPEILDDGVEGLLVPEGDSQALAAALEKLLDDDAARSAMSQAGPPKIADKFNCDKTIPQLEKVFRQSVQRCAAG